MFPGSVLLVRFLCVAFRFDCCSLLQFLSLTLTLYFWKAASCSRALSAFMFLSPFPDCFERPFLHCVTFLVAVAFLEAPNPPPKKRQDCWNPYLRSSPTRRICWPFYPFFPVYRFRFVVLFPKSVSGSLVSGWDLSGWLLMRFPSIFWAGLHKESVVYDLLTSTFSLWSYLPEFVISFVGIVYRVRIFGWIVDSLFILILWYSRLIFSCMVNVQLVILRNLRWGSCQDAFVIIFSFSTPFGIADTQDDTQSAVGWWMDGVCCLTSFGILVGCCCGWFFIPYIIWQLLLFRRLTRRLSFVLLEFCASFVWLLCSDFFCLQLYVSVGCCFMGLCFVPRLYLTQLFFRSAVLCKCFRNFFLFDTLSPTRGASLVWLLVWTLKVRLFSSSVRKCIVASRTIISRLDRFPFCFGISHLFSRRDTKYPSTAAEGRYNVSSLGRM